MNHVLRRCRIGILLASLLTCALVQAQEFRIGFVSTDRIFKEASTAKAAQVKLEQEFAKREKELVELGANLKTTAEKLDKEVHTLQEGQRASRQRQLVDQDREFQRKRREFQEDLNSRKNDELQKVIENANKVVKHVAEAEKYDLILQEAVYVNPKHDITDKVIKVLNSGGYK
ncbi:MAG: OmpH family outer membrane protein [Rhodoferax sp.]|jgi:outer membrane protein|nr:OmpH family outer membrane protein [Rhodoferax sp.]MBP9683678.1 OmpH family outer membrane protein [Rhodoferax sp.]